MRKRSFYFILGSFVYPVLICLFAEGCFNKEVKICDIEFMAGGRNTRSSAGPDTLRDSIAFVINDIKARKTCASRLNSALPQTHATSVCNKWQNSIDPSSFQMFLDKKVQIGNTGISPEKDLFEVPGFREALKITEDDGCSGYSIYLRLSDEFRKQMTFEQGTYRVTFNCSTSDQIKFSKQRSIVFEN